MGLKCNPKSPYQETGRGRSDTNRKGEEDAVTTEAETGGVQPQAKEYLETPEAGEDKKIHPEKARKECDPADTLISDFRPPDCERISFCRFKLPAPHICGHLL